MKSAIITAILIILSAVLAGQYLIHLSRAGNMERQASATAQEVTADARTAVFAGGCFWCTEADFEKVPGVIDAVSGYTGGHVANPSYEQVSAGSTGHVEAVKVIYDPAKVTYEQLLEAFWRHVDPTDAGGQFVDRGSQYRSVIFYADEEQQREAEASKEKLAASGRFDKPIVTEILPLGSFYPAEEYHQDYYKKNPIRYRWYRHGSGRDQFLAKVWGKDMKTAVQDNDQMKSGLQDQPKPAAAAAVAGSVTGGMVEQSSMGGERSYTIPDDAELRQRLTPLQYKVTRENGTEPAFSNAYWNNHEPGIYVDIISGEPLFSSTDKFESGTGWPSFTRPLVPGNIVEKKDRSFFMVRTEVRSKHADSHLGHVFDDGPPPTGLRYCINSAALRFIPASDLEKGGYGQYAQLFK